MKIDKMGVIVLMAHLVITLVVIAAYLFTLWLGKPDEIFKVAIPVIIGYWFGAMGATSLRKKTDETEEKKGA
jgi:hypothetical protein